MDHTMDAALYRPDRVVRSTRYSDLRNLLLEELRHQMGLDWRGSGICDVELKVETNPAMDMRILIAVLTLRHPHTGGPDLKIEARRVFDEEEIRYSENPTSLLQMYVCEIARDFADKTRRTMAETKRTITPTGVIKMGDPSIEWKEFMAEVSKAPEPSTPAPAKPATITPQPEDMRAESFGAW